MSNFKVNDKVVCVDDRPGLATGERRLIKDAEYVILDARSTWGSNEVKVNDGVGKYWLSSRFRKIEPAKPKVNYRLANLEILTQFPVIKERSDQPLIKEQEVEHA